MKRILIIIFCLILGGFSIAHAEEKQEVNMARIERLEKELHEQRLIVEHLYRQINFKAGDSEPRESKELKRILKKIKN